MANCDICGKKISSFNTANASVRSFSEYFSANVCYSCNIALDKIKAGDEDTYAQLKEIVESSANENTSKFFIAWVLESEIPEGKDAKERIIREKEAAEEKAKQDEENLKREKKADEYAAQIAKLKHAGSDGYYEYKVVKLIDSIRAGCLDANELMNTLNNMGLEGWRLVTAYSNELGKNALALGGFGVNATADEHILIFERFQKI